MIKAVLFDLDGTLADTAPDLGHALNLLRERHGLPPLPAGTIRPQASHGARGLLGLGFGITPEDAGFAALREEFLELYRAHICTHTHLFPGTAELLAELEKKGIAWGVVTNKPARFTEPLLEALGIASRAACIISGDTCSNPKPHPEPMLCACREVGATPDACLYVGDAERDVEAAEAAGIPTLVAAYGYLGPEDQPERWGAHAIISRPAEILRYL